MIRLYMDQKFSLGAQIELPPEELHYLRNVRREQGEVVLFNQQGQSARGRLEGECFLIDSVELAPTNVYDLTVAVGLPENSVVSKLVPGVSELGAKKLLFFGADRSQGAKRRLGEKSDRLQKLAIESARQSGRSQALEIETCPSLKDLDFSLYQSIWLFDEEGGEAPRITAQTIGPALVLIGCEGGWSAAEREYLRGLKGLCSIHLETPILKVQTAVICATFFGIQNLSPKTLGQK